MTNVCVVTSCDAGEIEVASVCSTIEKAEEYIQMRIDTGVGWSEDDFKIETFTVDVEEG